MDKCFQKVINSFGIEKLGSYGDHPGLEISVGHRTKSDMKTAMSDAKSPYT